MVVSDLSTGGLLNSKQANRFIDMLIEDTVISREARLERMTHPKQMFEKIGFNSRIMNPATEAVDPGAGAESTPATDKVELSTTEGIAIVKIGYSTLEDNIERGQLADHIVRLMAERAGLDLEEVYIQGDEAGSGWLGVNDGILKLATTHVADKSGADDTSDQADWADVVAAADEAFLRLPKKYLRNKREWRYYVHEDVEYQLRQALSERSTGAGDRFLLDDAPILVRGIPVTPVPMLPSTDETTAGDGNDDATTSPLVLVHPKNIVIGVQRAISIESDRLIRERAVEYVATLRFDVEFEEEDAVSVTERVLHSGTFSANA